MQPPGEFVEYFDVVDENDIVIDKKTRQEVHINNLLHRAVHIFVTDADSRIYLQRRAWSKDTAPGLWVTSCSGHVDSCEDYLESALRELREELGITATTDDVVEVFRHSATADTGYEFVRVYELCGWEKPIQPDPGEILQGTWKSPTEIDEWLLRAPTEFTRSFRTLWPLYREKN